MIGEFLRVVWVLPGLEFRRRVAGPLPSLRMARRMGQNRVRRPDASRRALQRVIRVTDRLLPGQPNCFRRVLIEMALDQGAALETINIGLRSGLAERSGHVWLSSSPPSGELYDAQISV